MEELMKELSFEEMEEFNGGANAQPPSGGGGSYKYSKAQCAAFLAACIAPKRYGCVSGSTACTLYKSYC